MSDFAHLLEPIVINRNLRLRNRMVKAPQSSWFFEEDGSAGDRVVGFYEALARGGVGLSILSAITWRSDHPAGLYGALWDDRFLPGITRIVERSHAHGCPIMCQLHHSGASAMTGHGGGLPIGPSDLGPDEIPCPPPVGKPVRGLSLEEIEEDKRLYFAAAERAHAAGFDGIEVHCAHGYYLESFVSRVWNRRDDQYGCRNIENRTRLVVEIITELRRRFGPDYPIGARINGREWGANGCQTIEEAVQTAQILERAGANYISVSGYGFGPLPFRYLPDYWPYPEPEDHMKPFMDDFRGLGLLVPAAEAVKKAVKVPVIAVGRMDEVKGEAVLAQGKADLVAFGRMLWADPEFPNKVKEGRIADITRCTRCGTCEDPPAGRPRRCRVNPAFGRESELAVPENVARAEQPGKVMVVGGGPSGMEAARVAALRGHDVTLYESAPALGGKLPLACMVKGTDVEDIRSIVPYFKHQLEKLGVKLRLGTTVTADMVRAEKPDVLILGTGGLYELPAIPGVESGRVTGVNRMGRQVKLPLRIFGPELLHRLTKIFLPVGHHVVILGGRIEGLQGAAFLLKRGRTVTVLEESENIGAGIPPRYLDRLLPWLKKKNVEIISGVKYEAIVPEGLIVTDKTGATRTVKGDTYMVLTSQSPNNSILDELEGRPGAPRIIRVGSANGFEGGSLIVNAIETGRRAGLKA